MRRQLKIFSRFFEQSKIDNIFAFNYKVILGHFTLMQSDTRHHFAEVDTQKPSFFVSAIVAPSISFITAFSAICCCVLVFLKFAMYKRGLEVEKRAISWYER